MTVAIRGLMSVFVAGLSIAVLSEVGRTALPMETAFPQQATVPFRVARLWATPPDEHLSMPVEGKRVRQIANTWQADRPGGRQHHGQDIFARRGTPIQSATEGIVVSIEETRIGGKTVWVMGAGGRSYYYAHLDRYADSLTIGDNVTPETTLGYVGNTGNARTTPPHLHFGIYTATGPINPLPLLEDRRQEPAGD